MDVVVTVPKAKWQEWLAEGGLPEDEPATLRSLVNPVDYGFVLPRRPNILIGERVYVVAHGRLRGYAPLITVRPGHVFGGGGKSVALVRRLGAMPCTIDEPTPGFRGFRYRWWERDREQAFSDWRTAGVTER